MHEHLPQYETSADDSAHDSFSREVATAQPRETQVFEFLTRLSVQANALALKAEAEAGRLGQLGRSMDTVIGEMKSMARRVSDAANGLQGNFAKANKSPTLVYGLVSLPHSNAVPMQISEREAELFSHHLPASAHAIADVIGMELTLVLIRECRGSSIILHGKDYLFIANILGIEAAEKLRKWLGVSPLCIPACRAAQKALLEHRIRAEFDHMTTVENLSSRMAVRALTQFSSPPMHERTIWRILKRSDETKEPEEAKKCIRTQNFSAAGFRNGQKLK